MEKKDAYLVAKKNAALQIKIDKVANDIRARQADYNALLARTAKLEAGSTEESINKKELVNKLSTINQLVAVKSDMEKVLSNKLLMDTKLEAFQAYSDFYKNLEKDEGVDLSKMEKTIRKAKIKAETVKRRTDRILDIQVESQEDNSRISSTTMSEVERDLQLVRTKNNDTESLIDDLIRKRNKIDE